MITHTDELRNVETSELLLWLDVTYWEQNFYVINGHNPGEPVDPNSYVILIYMDGSRIAWFTPESKWNTYSNYPVFSSRAASAYEHKMHVGSEPPYDYIPAESV
ncbi:hypothetical protein [Serratia marcescens]|uniref:hypothetical protein n=1 Tax=Serratia marcescens TaxID=615 RepID=UPI0013DBB3C1|nr:hypothetical protein [Serratia marcescens]